MAIFELVKGLMTTLMGLQPWRLESTSIWPLSKNGFFWFLEKVIFGVSKKILSPKIVFCAIWWSFLVIWLKFWMWTPLKDRKKVFFEFFQKVIYSRSPKNKIDNFGILIYCIHSVWQFKFTHESLYNKHTGPMSIYIGCHGYVKNTTHPLFPVFIYSNRCRKLSY